MVVGGFDGDFYLDHVQIIDLEEESGECAFNADNYPITIRHVTLGRYPGVNAVSACGGFSNNGGTEVASCFDYDPRTNSWSQTLDLSEAKQMPSSCLVGSDRWLVSGGPNAAGSVNTDMRSVDGFSVPGPTVPDGVYMPCQVAINDTHVFLADQFDQLTYILDTESGEWHQQVSAIIVTKNTAGS